MLIFIQNKFWQLAFYCILLTSYIPPIIAAETLEIGRAAALSPISPTKQRTNLIIQASRMLDIEINFRDLPARRSLKLVSEGVLNAEIGRHSLIESEFPDLVRVNEPIGYLDYWVWVHEATPCLLKKTDLKMLKPVGVRGILFFDQLIYPNSEVGYEKVNNLSQLSAMLIKGRADYSVHSKALIHSLNSKTEDKFKTCFEQPLFTLNFYLYLHPSKQHLKVPFEGALRKIKYGY